MSSIFSHHTIDFLQGLQDNNNKPWFQTHEAEYRQYVLAPLVHLVESLSETMLDIDSDFETTPTINKTISRIYRDTRFSKDKSLFRCKMWITFKRPGSEWQDAPGYYFEISPDHFSYGMGLYHASKETMDAFRAGLETKPEEFLRAIAFLAHRPDMTVGGDQYKKTLNAAIPVGLLSWYQRKTFYIICNHAINDRLFGDNFAGELAADFKLMAPLYYYMWELKGIIHSQSV